MRDQKRNSVEIVRVGAFSKELVSEETIYRVLKGFGFVPEESAFVIQISGAAESLVGMRNAISSPTVI